MIFDMTGKRRQRDNKLTLDVGLRIHKAMGDMSLTDLARLIGRNTNTVWSYVNGGSLPSIEILLKISEALKVSVEYLLRGEVPGSLMDRQEAELIRTYRAIRDKDPRVAEDYIRYGRGWLTAAPAAEQVKKKVRNRKLIPPIDIIGLDEAVDALSDAEKESKKGKHPGSQGKGTRLMSA